MKRISILALVCCCGTASFAQSSMAASSVSDIPVQPARSTVKTKPAAQPKKLPVNEAQAPAVLTTDNTPSSVTDIKPVAVVKKIDTSGSVAIMPVAKPVTKPAEEKYSSVSPQIKQEAPKPAARPLERSSTKE